MYDDEDEEDDGGGGGVDDANYVDGEVTDSEHVRPCSAAPRHHLPSLSHRFTIPCP